jgi:hypothetical protein
MHRPLSAILGALAIVCVLGAHPALAAPPILIVNCVLENNGGYGGEVADMHITFQNVSAVTATSIKFRAVYRGKRAAVVAKGSYAPNVKISNRFHVFTDQYWDGKNLDLCVPINATFSDGTSWTSNKYF